MKIPLEDTVADIIGKAQNGLNINDVALAERAEVPIEIIRALKSGEWNADLEGNVVRIANALHLKADALVEIADHSWYPAPVRMPGGFAAFNTQFSSDMTVNCYLVWDVLTKEAALFDTGMDATKILETLVRENLKLSTVFLTHTHPDHVHALDRILADAPEAVVRVSEREPFPDAELFETGRGSYQVGSLVIEPRPTHGHSPGGTTYVVRGFSDSSILAIVGDAMFAGSEGGVMHEQYQEARRLNSDNILTLPDQTIICPGHGPLTTVGEEKEHNPFYS